GAPPPAGQQIGERAPRRACPLWPLPLVDPLLPRGDWLLPAPHRRFSGRRRCTLTRREALPDDPPRAASAAGSSAGSPCACDGEAGRDQPSAAQEKRVPAGSPLGMSRAAVVPSSPLGVAPAGQRSLRTRTSAWRQ